MNRCTLEVVVPEGYEPVIESKWANVYLVFKSKAAVRPWTSKWYNTESKCHEASRCLGDECSCIGVIRVDYQDGSPIRVEFRSLIG